MGESFVKRVLVTKKAKAVINKLQREHGDLMFHLSGGCCDGTSPMCFVKGEFRIGDGDALLGEIGNCPFYISKGQYKFFKNSQLTVDVIAGRGASFSLEVPLGIRFIVKSRLFTEFEASLAPESP